jgi:hypothetical protein
MVICHDVGIYGAQFPHNNGAFSAVTLFQTIGFISGFICSIYFCTSVKTYIYLGLTFLSFITYSFVSIKNSYFELKNLKKAKYINDDNLLFD